MLTKSYKGLWLDDAQETPEWGRANCLSDAEGNFCGVHLPDCDGSCRHMSGHINECILVASKAIREMIERRERRDALNFESPGDGTLIIHTCDAKHNDTPPVTVPPRRIAALVTACVDALQNNKGFR